MEVKLRDGILQLKAQLIVKYFKTSVLKGLLWRHASDGEYRWINTSRWMVH